MEEFFKAVANFGFPIVVATYLLLRMEKTIAQQKEELEKLKDAVREACDRINKL